MQKYTTIAISSLLMFAQLAEADDWLHWRGTNRNDVVTEASRWSKDEWLPQEAAWHQEIGEGSTSPIVVGNRVFVLGWQSNQDLLSCLDVKTGKVIWSSSYDCPRHGRFATGDEGFYSGPTSTPEYDTSTGYIYTLSCDGNLNCWDSNMRGKSVWSVSLYDKLTIGRRPRVGRSGLRDYGYTTAPFVYGDWVIVEAGAKEGSLVAFSKSTGQQVWTSQATGPAGHTGGLIPIEVEGIPCVAVMRYQGLLVARLDKGSEGKTVAEFEWITDFINNIATPAVHDNHVLITSAYNHQKICKLVITLNGARKIWEQPYSSKVCSPIIHDGHVYWAWQQMHCLDFETGELKWQGGNFGDAGSCILTSDQRLIVWGGQGKLAVVDTAVRSPSKYSEIAVRDNLFSSDVWPHVVLADGRLYCKSREGQLLCFKLDDRP